MIITITSVVNHGEFLQAFATVTDEGVTKQLSTCFKSLRFKKDEVFNMFQTAFYAPPVVESKPSGEPLPVEPVDIKPRVPDVTRVANVLMLENAFKALPVAQRKMTIATATAIEEPIKK